jgi:predicted Zn finger-like uncharacterized protein
VDESVIVSCPACATRFSLDAALLGDAGRSVRCAKCSHKWRQMPPKVESPQGEFGGDINADMPPPQAEPSPGADSAPAPLPEAAPVAESAAPAQPPVDIPAAPPRPRSPQRPTGPITIPPKLRPVMPKRRGLLRPIAFLVIGLLIGLLGAAYFFRAEIARAVPAFDLAYSLMGISTSNPAKDLDIGNLVFNRRNEDGQSFISIQGDIFNKSEFPVQLPNMVAIPLGRDEAGNSTVLQPDHRFRIEQDVIEPGETVSFRTLFKDPPKGSKILMVDFLK